MALSFVKKSAASSTVAKSQSSKPSPAQDEETGTPTTTSKKNQTPGTVASWMKKGKDAHEAVAKEEAKAALAKEAKDRMWRYWMPAEAERKVTFLDGEVDADGMLDVPMFYEHQLKINGDFENFVCTQESEGYCPICEKGESQPYLCGVMTVIDHSAHKVKSGPNAGKTIQHTRKIFVAKKNTLKILSKIAAKRDGLTGCTFDVSRGDDHTASVGSQFDFTKKQKLSVLAEEYDLKLEDVQPADYSYEIVYRTGDELVELGIGKASGGVGKEAGVHDKKKLASEL